MVYKSVLPIAALLPVLTSAQIYTASFTEMGPGTRTAVETAMLRQLLVVSSPLLATVQLCLKTSMGLVPGKALGPLVAGAGKYLVRRTQVDSPCLHRRQSL